MEIKKAQRIKAMDAARTSCPELYDRLMANAVRPNEESCWTWALAKDKDGYGTLKFSGKNIKAHRAMDQLFRPFDTGPLVRHLCHNPSCVNPLHLRGGTPRDNAMDRVIAGRGGKVGGSKNGRAKLNAADALVIRQSDKTGATLGREFGISKAMACRIKRGAAWV